MRISVDGRRIRNNKVTFSNLSGIVRTGPNTKKYRFQIVPLWRAFSKSSVFVDLFMRISVDGRRIRNNKVAFSNLSGTVWTGPYCVDCHIKSPMLPIYMHAYWLISYPIRTLLMLHCSSARQRNLILLLLLYTFYLSKIFLRFS